jgi:hypothetical protein
MNNPNPFDPKYGQAVADMTNAFLNWPLPESVSSDGCVTRPGKGRTGTNLLTLTETLQMMQEVVCPIIANYLDDRPATYSYKLPMNNPTKASDQNERAELQQALEDPENQPSQFGTVPMNCLKGVHANKEMTPLQNCPGAQGASFILPATEQVEQVLKQLGVVILPHD